MRVTLTDLFIQKVKPIGKQAKYLCNRTPNFGLLLSQAGGKSFFAVVGRERKRIHLGKYPATTLAEARRKAAHLDVAPYTSLTYREAVDLYLQTYVRPNYRPRSASEVERHLAKLKDQPLNELTTRDITDLLDTLPPSEANHTFGVLRTFFNWCERRDHIQRNPLRKLTKPHKEQSRDRVLSRKEIKKIWAATKEPTTYHAIVRLCLFTGQRRGEVSQIRPEWIEGDILTFPASVTKNGRQHSIPLGATARALVQYLDPSYTHWGKPKRRLDMASGVAGWCIHDLRRTVSTYMAELGVPPHIVDAILNHAPQGVRARYNRYRYMTEMRHALDGWEREVLQLVSPEGCQ
jgi:integrase